MDDLEAKLPASVLGRIVRSGQEYGWRKEDVVPAIEAATEAGLATIGGEVQFLFSDGICELYWLGFDSTARRQNEVWSDYTARTERECISSIEPYYWN